MVHIKEFAVERWMDEYEDNARYNLAETCCASVSLNDLEVFAGSKSTNIIDFSKKQIYGAIRDGDVKPSQVLVTNGAIQANFLALYTNVGVGDHVICQYPTYQQLYSAPESFGAEVSLWRSDETKEWGLHLEELEKLVQPNTKLIILNNPQNPTGAVLSRETLQGIVDFARKHRITIHSDEVYRPLFHSTGSQNPPSILSFGYEKCYATGSMSKAFSLAGIRLGWIVSADTSIIDACASTRDYTTISVSQVDDQIATFALSLPTRENLMQRNIQLARENLALVNAFVGKFSWACQWTRPKAGTTAFIKFFSRNGRPIRDVEFCERLIAKTGAMLVPGSRCFGGDIDFRGYVRLGYVQESQIIVDGLKVLEDFMRSEYETLPTY
ncbi:putative aminotransferase [Aureobasidium pullulans]|uniref:Putative aminotransferase n=1 Tax=Aureobasidium pullulans TaxID=5580 RepID=A0A4S9N9L9_AURPU|nr:putative aminotransferase [Aureobasidium pullulans]THY53249.1 putative aminotransferase [Aureobasidium pullulans]